MINIKVQTNGLLELKAKLAGMADKQVAFATSRALNVAAYAATQAVGKEMAKVFDRPTPWVLKSVRYTKADKRNLTATVDFDFWGNKQGVTVAHVLRAEIHGGQRKNKRFELALQRAGVLPAGMAITPGPAAKKDQYGNMDPGQIQQVLSWFQAFGEQGYRANMTDRRMMQLMKGVKKNGVRQRGFELFALRERHGKLAPGIYMRKDYTAAESARVSHLSHGGAAAVMFFTRMPNYKRRLDFYGLAERVARAEFDRQYPAMLTEAMRTAR